MEAPKEMELDRSKVLKLLKALYGLKQASRQWHKHVRKLLTEELGYRQLVTDSCVFIKGEGGNKIIVVLYVDDFIMAAKSMFNNSIIGHTSRGKVAGDRHTTHSVLGNQLCRQSRRRQLRFDRSRRLR